MSWEDMSPGAIRAQLYAIAEAVEMCVAVLTSALTNLDALGIELGELLRGGTEFSEGSSALDHLKNSIHNWLTHAIADATAAAQMIRESTNIL